MFIDVVCYKYKMRKNHSHPKKKGFNCHIPFSEKKAKGKLRKSLSIWLESLVLTNFILKKAYVIIIIDT